MTEDDAPPPFTTMGMERLLRNMARWRRDAGPDPEMWVGEDGEWLPGCPRDAEAAG